MTHSYDIQILLNICDFFEESSPEQWRKPISSEIKLDQSLSIFSDEFRQQLIERFSKEFGFHSTGEDIEWLFHLLAAWKSHYPVLFSCKGFQPLPPDQVTKNKSSPDSTAYPFPVFAVSTPREVNSPTINIGVFSTHKTGIRLTQIECNSSNQFSFRFYEESSLVNFSKVESLQSLVSATQLFLQLDSTSTSRIKSELLSHNPSETLPTVVNVDFRLGSPLNLEVIRLDAQKGEGGGWSVVPHLRRSHIRRYSDGSQVQIRATKVNQDKGAIKPTSREVKD